MHAQAFCTTSVLPLHAHYPSSVILEVCARMMTWSRLFFDTTTKSLPASSRVGVTSEPEHTVMEVTPQDRFIVLASDGVWEFISSQEAVDIIAQYPTAEESCRQVRHSPGPDPNGAGAVCLQSEKL